MAAHMALFTLVSDVAEDGEPLLWLEAAEAVLPTLTSTARAELLDSLLIAGRESIELEPAEARLLRRLVSGAERAHLGVRRPGLRGRRGARRARRDQRLRRRRRRDRGRGMTDGVATAAAAKSVVTGLGGAFMISSQAKAAGKDGGYRGWQLYVTGRAGVLGEVGTEVVHAALGFLHPDRVRAGLGGRPGGRAAGRHRGAVRRGVPGLGPDQVRRPGRGRPARRPARTGGRRRRPGRLAAVRRLAGPAAARRRARPGRPAAARPARAPRRTPTSAPSAASACARWRRSSPAPADRATRRSSAGRRRCPRSPTSCAACWPARSRPPTPRSARRTPCSTQPSRTTCCGCSRTPPRRPARKPDRSDS